MEKVLFRRRKGTQELDLISSRPFDRKHSEEDLHRFLETEPSLIARGISRGEPIPTLVVASHLQLENGELDLLLLDSEGELTVAELKRGRTPGEVTAQVIDYASQIESSGVSGLSDLGVDWDQALELLALEGEESHDLDYDRLGISIRNPRLLVVAFEIDEATRRIAEYLRGRGIPIFCIEFEYFADDEYEYYYPEVIGVDEVRRIAAAEETPTQREYRRIWRELIGSFKELRPGITRRSESKDAWVSLPIGISTDHLEWGIHGLNRKGGWFEVGLHFESADRDRNLRVLKFVKDQCSVIEKILGEELMFEEWGKRWARAYLRREAPAIDDEVKSWALEKMIRFYDAIDEMGLLEKIRAAGV